MRRAVQIRDEVQPLDLELPAIFRVKPAHEVALPANCRALIYDTTVQRETRIAKGGSEYKPVKAWRIVIVNKNGRTPRAIGEAGYGGRYGGDNTLSDPLDVRRYLETVAWKLSKIKTTTVTEADADE